jgi:hypothetical protein
MLGSPKPLDWKPAEKGMVLQIPDPPDREVLCRDAWVFKLTGLKSLD